MTWETQKLAGMGQLGPLAEYHMMIKSGAPLTGLPGAAAAAASAPEPLPDAVNRSLTPCPAYRPPPPPPPAPAPRPPRAIEALDPINLDYGDEYWRPPEPSFWGTGTVFDKAWLVRDAASGAALLRPRSWTTCHRVSGSNSWYTETHPVKRHVDSPYGRLSTMTDCSPWLGANYDEIDCMGADFDQIDCDNNGNISVLEASYWGVPAIDFQNIDLNGDGHVQKRPADLAEGAEWSRLVQAIEDLMFAEYDTNGNGVLDVVATPPDSRSEYENAFVLDFSDFDIEGSCAAGVSLSAAEEHWISKSMPCWGCSAYFSMLDVDGSGCIDQPAEFASAFGYGPNPPAQKALGLPSGWGDDQVYTW